MILAKVRYRPRSGTRSRSAAFAVEQEQLVEQQALLNQLRFGGKKKFPERKETVMRRVKVFLVSAALVGTTMATPVRADGFGWGLVFGALIGAPLIASTYYYRPYYYPPYGYAPYYGYAPTYVPAYTQPSYVEQRPTPAQPAYSWYYCPSSNGYYPYVKQCSEGWQQISPTPPGV
jgi:hypothetical protein